MGASQRNKGAAAERELRKLLSDELGCDVLRNYAQAAQGGHDLLGVGPFALEVKRAETLRIPEWWLQACAQADEAGLVPALAYRQSRQPWAFMVPLPWLMDCIRWDEWTELDDKALLSLGGFAYLVRERMDDRRAA